MPTCRDHGFRENHECCADHCDILGICCIGHPEYYDQREAEIFAFVDQEIGATDSEAENG
jgi:hypothetical protein